MNIQKESQKINHVAGKARRGGGASGGMVAHDLVNGCQAPV